MPRRTSSGPETERHRAFHIAHRRLRQAWNLQGQKTKIAPFKGTETPRLPNPPQSPAGWSDSNLGQWILAEEAPLLADLVRRFHGDILVWSGPTPAATAGVKRCMVRNCFYAAVPDTPSHAELASFQGCLGALPLPNRSADGVVLHHSLEAEQDPRQALREVSRVIAPGGRLLICAFNSLSLWGLRALYGRLHDDLFSGMKFVNPLRLFDWLALLGFKPEGPAAYLGFGLPLHLGWRRRPRLGAWLGRVQPPTGGIILVSALKQAQGASWVGRRKAPEPAHVAPVAYPKPTAWRPLERYR